MPFNYALPVPRLPRRIRERRALLRHVHRIQPQVVGAVGVWQAKRQGHVIAGKSSRCAQRATHRLVNIRASGHGHAIRVVVRKQADLEALDRILNSFVVTGTLE